MDQRATQEISLLLNGFPQARDTDPSGLLYSFGLAVEGLSTEAIVDAARRYGTGRVEGQSTEYAPSPAAFAQEARRRQEAITLRNTPYLPAPSRAFGGPAPFQVAQERARHDNARRAVLKTDATFDEFKAMSRAGDLPAGSSWVACLSTIYGPEPKQAVGE